MQTQTDYDLTNRTIYAIILIERRSDVENINIAQEDFNETIDLINKAIISESEIINLLDSVEDEESKFPIENLRESRDKLKELYIKLTKYN